MNYMKRIDFDSISNFHKDNSLLSIVERPTPEKANLFFKQLLLNPFNINEKVFKKNSYEDIKRILDKNLPNKVKITLFIPYGLKICQK